MAQAVLERFGAINVLTNNASLVSVLPQTTFKVGDDGQHLENYNKEETGAKSTFARTNRAYEKGVIAEMAGR